MIILEIIKTTFQIFENVFRYVQSIALHSAVRYTCSPALNKRSIFCFSCQHCQCPCVCDKMVLKNLLKDKAKKLNATRKKKRNS